MSHFIDHHRTKVVVPLIDRQIGNKKEILENYFGPMLIIVRILSCATDKISFSSIYGFDRVETLNYELG